MKISTLLNANCPEIAIDTLESIITFIGKDNIVCVDSAFWDKFKNLSIPAYKLKGFYHNYPKAPYKNVALGLKTLYETFPDSDWFLYLEQDCLITSNEFIKNLRHADYQDVWMLGSNGKQEKTKIKLPLIEAIIKEEISTCHKMLGSCMFFCKEFLERLDEINFFEKLINISATFTKGYFPQYTGYDLSEHLYPTLATHWGGDIGSFSSWDETKKEWSGNYRKFPIRWKPELNFEKENFKEISIAHPIKTIDSEIRKYHKIKRKNIKTPTRPKLL